MENEIYVGNNEIPEDGIIKFQEPQLCVLSNSTTYEQNGENKIIDDRIALLVENGYKGQKTLPSVTKHGGSKRT